MEIEPQMLINMLRDLNDRILDLEKRTMLFSDKSMLEIADNQIAFDELLGFLLDYEE